MSSLFSSPGSFVLVNTKHPDFSKKEENNFKKLVRKSTQVNNNTPVVSLNDYGTIWGWGYNDSYQLGLGEIFTNILVPTQIGVADTWKTIESSKSTYSSGAIKTDGTLWVWGDNYAGGLGLNDLVSRSVPTQVGTDTNWKDIAVGSSSFSLALKTDGTLWSSGNNLNGQLGLGDTTSRKVYTQITAINSVSKISVGDRSCYAIKTDGTLWVWGRNSYGELGLGNTTNTLTPTQVGTGTNWKDVFSGYGHVLAIKTDGTLWGCGFNQYGQLGVNDKTNRNTFTQIGTDSNWKSVSAGYIHSLGIKTDGTLWGWGGNVSGELGFGDNTERLIPTQNGNATDWSSISAGTEISIGLKIDGTLYGWGLNSFGELGLNDTVTRTSPTQIGSSNKWVKIATYGNHVLAIQSA